MCLAEGYNAAALRSVNKSLQIVDGRPLVRYWSRNLDAVAGFITVFFSSPTKAGVLMTSTTCTKAQRRRQVCCSRLMVTSISCHWSMRVFLLAHYLSFSIARMRLLPHSCIRRHSRRRATTAGKNCRSKCSLHSAVITRFHRFMHISNPALFSISPFSCPSLFLTAGSVPSLQAFSGSRLL